MYILCDIGGTNMRITRSRDLISFDEPIIQTTPRDFDEGITLFAETAKKLSEGMKIRGIGGGVAGNLTPDKKTLHKAPHLPGWNGKALADSLAKACDTSVFLENDTAIVGLGEAVAGAGRGYNSVAYMTVSTGVGGVRLVGERIDLSAMGFEPGHQIIDASGGFRSAAGYVGGFGPTLEGVVSGTAITDRYKVKPYELTDEKFWDEMARLLAFGVNNTIVHWSPDVFVIGGSMMKKIGIPIDRVEAHLKGMLHIYPHLPVLKKAELGDIGGLHGALAYLNQNIRK